MTASHDAATCPAFGGCSDCRSAKFEAASPDVVLPTALADSQILSTREMAEVDPWTISAHAFNAAVNKTLDQAKAVSDQRAGEYLDTWHLNNQSTPFVDSVLRFDDGENAAEQSPEWKRLLVVAALIDVKCSRMMGPWKPDTVEDLVNYLAAFRTWREEYKEATGV